MAITDLLKVPYKLQIVYPALQDKYVNQVKVLLNALQASIALLEKPSQGLVKKVPGHNRQESLQRMSARFVLLVTYAIKQI